MTATISSVFERILVASTLEEATINVLVDWFPTYLHEMENQLDLDRDSLPIPKNYTNRNTYEMIPPEEIPKVICISPGISGNPVQTGRGTYTARWRVGVGVAWADRTEPRANMIVKILGACVRAIVPQQAVNLDIPGLADVRWVQESYDDLPIRAQSQLAKAAQVWFDYDIANVLNKRAGPNVHDLPPDTYTYPTVERVIIDLVKEPIVDE